MDLSTSHAIFQRLRDGRERESLRGRGEYGQNAVHRRRYGNGTTEGCRDIGRTAASGAALNFDPADRGSPQGHIGPSRVQTQCFSHNLEQVEPSKCPSHRPETIPGPPCATPEYRTRQASAAPTFKRSLHPEMGTHGILQLCRGDR